MPSLSEALQKFSVVVITGGSSGIGKSFIGTMGKLNPRAEFCNLSRTEPHDFDAKLKLRHIRTDLARSADIEAAAAAVVAQLNLTMPAGEILLINNSGFGTYGEFPNPRPAEQLEMIDVNVRGLVHLTALLLPHLRQRGGAILNVASIAGFQPTPYLAVYGATKSFVLHWSLALNEELRGTGVRSIAVCPGPTSSNFFQRAGLEKPSVPDSLGMTCDEVAEISLRALAAGKAQVVPGWKNALGALAGSTLPPAWSARVARGVINKHRLSRIRK